MTGFSLVVVSNRGPFTLVSGPGGDVEFRPAAGGLAPSLSGALAEERTIPGAGALWVASALTEADRLHASGCALATGQDSLKLRMVSVAGETGRAAYDVISNGTLWFLHHGLFDHARRPRFDRVWHEAWEGYCQFNEAFADTIADEAATGATVVVNDYHLALVGSYLAKRRPDLATAFFSHTPFCPPEDLAMLPDGPRLELMESMSRFGACGFHSARWRDAFLRCVSVAGVEPPATFVAPLGADPARLDEVAASEACRACLDRLEDHLDGRTLLLRSDRVELSKNLIRGFVAFDELLESSPQWRGRLVFLARVYASRESLPEYLAYRTEVEHVAARVNERWGAQGYTPVVLDLEDDFTATVAALRRYDLLLVNPIRDGLNLVAMEGPAVNERDGVLVLSREAGAYDELGDVAIGVNPFDVTGTAAAMAAGLSMSDVERRARSVELRRRARSRTPSHWLAEVRGAARVPA
ncbi:MAG: trehalose-6-phosphate synthase [Acidimicrobiales bacterium]|jgi:trehalose 6-phosphate synthase